MSLWNIRHASQHVLINRDGGAYTNAGRWIAMHGNLRVVAAVGPFARQPALTFGSFGMYPTRGGTLSFQFAHLLPALLAEAHNLGGDRLMFAATSLLSGVALLAFFVAAWRLVRNPFVALAALVSFAFLLPEVSFSRDTYSEIPMQVLIFTGLWILVDRAAFRRPRLALVAGLVLGMLQAARIDALAALTGLAPLFAVVWLVADARDRRSVALSGAALGIGLVPGVVLGFTDVSLRSYGYLHDLRSDVKLLVAAMVASIAVAAVLVIVVPPVARRIRRVPSWVAPVAGAGVGLVGFGLWFLRPRLQHVHGVSNPLVGGLQEAARVAVDPTRTYAERTMTWMSWYLGPLTVAAAIVAAALLVWMLVRGRMLFTLAGIALLGPSSAIYLWRPNISSDQIWVMRRYLFSALPLLTLLAFGLVAALVGLVPRRLPAGRAGRVRGRDRRGGSRLPDRGPETGPEHDRTTRQSPRGARRVPRHGRTRGRRAPAEPDGAAVGVGTANLARLVQRAGCRDGADACPTGRPSSSGWPGNGRSWAGHSGSSPTCRRRSTACSRPRPSITLRS